jgi:hypothetical protein
VIEIGKCWKNCCALACNQQQIYLLLNAYLLGKSKQCNKCPKHAKEFSLNVEWANPIKLVTT